jgi:RimJ/RimL family protein N-acetyltransferase
LEEVRRNLGERARHRLGSELDGEGQWVFEAGGVPARWITLRIVYRALDVGELGYSLSTALHRRGYMSAALKLVLPLAFDPTAGADLWRLEASVAFDNIGSRTVLERAGFQLEGVAHASAISGGWRVDHAQYALLRPGWLHSQRLSGG